MADSTMRFDGLISLVFQHQIAKRVRRKMLRGLATVGVNAVVWIMSLDPEEQQSTEQVLTFLEAFLKAKNIPFHKYEPKTAEELSQVLTDLEAKAKAGLRPIIHFDTHGDEKRGLYIDESEEYFSWERLVALLRPVNIATRNNLCIVSAACESMHVIMNMDFNAATPFFLMFAPRQIVTFGFVERHMFEFYEEVFVSSDVMSAHENHLAPLFEQFHCHRLVLKGLAGYMRDNCTGRGLRKRVRVALKQMIGPGKQHPDTLENRRIVRKARIAIARPNQALIDRHAKPFLLGQTLPFAYEDILAFAREEAMRMNVFTRRAAGARRRIRKRKHARLRALKRRCVTLGVVSR